MSDKPVNYYKEAFMNPANLAFLIVGLTMALLVNDWVAVPELILMFTAAAELMYLGIVPRSDRFRRVVKSRRNAEQSRPPKEHEVFRTLAREDQKRYVRFRNLEKVIRENYGKLRGPSQALLEAQLKKLDGLLDSYLNLLQLKERYTTFSQRTAETEIVTLITQLRGEIATDPPRVARLKERRMAVLEKRLDKYKKAKENLAVIETQLQTIEDVTKYVYEQSLTMQNPDEVAFQLDTLLSEVEETQASVQEIEDVFADPTSLLGEFELDEFDASVAARDPDRLDAGPLDDDLSDDDRERARQRGRVG